MNIRKATIEDIDILMNKSFGRHMRKVLIPVLLVMCMVLAVACGSTRENRPEDTTSVEQTSQGSVVQSTEASAAPAAAKFEKPDIQVVSVPGGTIKVASNKEYSIKAFKVGKYEVKYLEWEAVYKWGESHGYKFANSGAMGYGQSTGRDHPVTIVSWMDMIAWCNAASEMMGLKPVYYTSPERKEFYKTSSNESIKELPDNITEECVDPDANGYRLPTEQEWEYAARYIDGKSVTPADVSSGAATEGEEDAYCWYKANSGGGTHAVGQKKPNALGLFDMCGNVAELCFNNISMPKNVTVEKTDEKAQAGATVINRGGRYSSSSGMVHCKFFGLSFSENPNAGVGFRVALNE